ncbi:MAG: PAS domain-containing protein [Xanthobacteraceae bacterium]|nr:PAS domain-containing protein [Xanthobacteraceae bacterium]
MKHPSVRAYYNVWNEKRGSAAAPDRSDLDPGAVRDLLGDIFVLSCDRRAGYPFRVAGTRVCALLGCDAKGRSFTDLFAPDSRAEIEEVLGIVSEESQPAVAGISARSAEGLTVPLELLLLPFSARAHAPLSLTGLLAPLHRSATRVDDFTLLSWRYIVPRPTDRPRALRRWTAARGFFVYEGLR